MLSEISLKHLYNGNKCSKTLRRTTNRSFSGKEYTFECDGLSLMSSYNQLFVQKRDSIKSIGSRELNRKKLYDLGIPNYALAPNNGIRGESLSSKKNRKFIPRIKKAGVSTVIDLRDKYRSETYQEACEKNGLKYYSIPVDSNSVSDRDIIDNLPLLFDVINNDNYYISCAQGLHRTDIALALNYVFNPSGADSMPPVLIGHIRDFGFKYDDISTRLNSIKKALTPDDILKLGWDCGIEDFYAEAEKRKKDLLLYNQSLCDDIN